MNKLVNRIVLFLLLLSVQAYSQQPRIVPTKGTEFWLGFMEQQNEYASTKRLNIFISSDRNTTGTLTIPAQGYSQSFTVNSNVTTTINVPNNIAEHLSDETIDNKGILIQTADTVSVYAINFQQYSADGSLVLPRNSLGTEYRITSYPALSGGYGFRSTALIVATEDNTQIDIIPSVNTMGGKTAGNTYTIALNAGQSYQIKGLTENDDLTGTIIKSTPQSGPCRAFAVYSGNICVNIPNGCTACDVLFEQEYPTYIWGKNYMIPPFSFATSYTYRVLADLNGTTFSVNGGPSLNLNAGQFYEANNVTGPVYITANNRISVMQFMQGVSCAGAGDPSQLAINPVGQVLTDITFSTVTSSVITQHDVNVIMKSAYINQLTLDGITVNPSSFLTFTPNPSYSYAQLNLTQGSHTLAADSGFVAYAYGTGSAESYAYPLGSFMQQTIIPTDTVYCTTSSVTLTPPEILNSPQWVTASNPGTVISTSLSITITPTTNEVYTITGLSQLSGCPKTYNFSVEIPNPPALTITQSKDTVCRFDKVQLNVSVNPSSSSYIYRWFPTTGLSNPSIADPIATPLQSMWYYCTVSTLHGCTTNTDSVFIAVRSGKISDVNASASPTLFCRGDSSQLNLSIENIIFQDSINPSYTPSLWSSVSGGAASNLCGSVSGNALYFNGAGSRLAATTSLNVINGGTIYFSLKISNGTAPCDNTEPGEDVVLEYSINGGVSWTLLTTYNENQYPNFTYLSVPIPVAAKTTATRFRWRQVSNSGIDLDNWALDNIYIGAINNAAAAFHWSPSTDLSNATIANPIATPDSTIMYYATVIDNFYGCTYIDSVLIDVGQPFTLNVSNDDTVCQASGTRLFANPSIPGRYSYLWTPAGTLSSNNVSNPVVTPISTTLYHINVTSIEGCSAHDSVRIYVPLISTFYTSPHIDSICRGDSIQITTTYERGCGVNGTTCSGTISNVHVGAATTTSTSNNVTLYNGSYLSSRFQLLFTKAELNALGINSAITLKEIGFNIGSINGNNIYNNFTIRMRCTNKGVLSSSFEGGTSTVFNPKNVVLSNGINYYVLDNTFDWDGVSNIIVDVCYTNSGTSANSSTYYSNSSFNSFLAVSSTSACSALTGTLSTNKPNTYFKYCSTPSLPSLTYTWNPSIGLNNSTIPNPVARPVSSTAYLITARDSVSGCVFEDSVKITAGPLFSLSSVDSIINCNTNGVQLSVTPSLPGTYTYNWTPAANLNNNKISNPIAYPLSTTYFKVSATSEFGCEVRDTIKVVIRQLASFYAIPPIDTICSGHSIQLNTFYQKSCGTNASSCGGPVNSAQVGAGSTNSSSSSITPYKGSFNGSKIQMLYTKSELNAAGVNSAKTLTGLGFNIASISGNNIYQNFTIKMGCATVTNLTTTFQSGLSTVFNTKNVVLSSGINYYVFDNTFDWDGVSNVIVEICYNNSSTSSNSATYYSTTSNNSVSYVTGNSVCAVTTGTITTSRPNTYFKYCSANAPSSLQYSWSPSISLSNDSIANPVASPTVSTNYYVTAVDSSAGCVFSDSIYIKTIQDITLDLTNDTTICLGQSITLNAGNNFTSYLWNDGSHLSTKNVSLAGVYWVETSNLCRTQRDTCLLQVNNELNKLNLGNDTVVCNGSQVVFRANQSNYNSYLWQDGSTLSSFTVTAAGNYKVRVSNECGSKMDSVHLSTQFPLPVRLGNDTSICVNTSLLLDAGNAYNSYLWQNGSSARTFLITTAGIYHVSTANVCGTYGDSIVVTNISPPGVDLGADRIICSGDSVLLNANNCNNCNYLWQNGSSNATFNAHSVGIYRVIASNKCGSKTDSVYVSTQFPLPVRLGNDTSICVNTSLLLDAGNAYNSYLWQNGSSARTFLITTAGIYHVSTANVCGTYGDSIVITNISPPGVDLGTDRFICSGDSVLLHVNNCANCNYLWQNGSSNATFNAHSFGVYSVIASNKCGTDQDSVILNQISLPLVSLGDDTSFCQGEHVTIDATYPGSSYLWQNGSTNNTLDIYSGGVYWVNVTNYCGMVSDTFKVNRVFPLPIVNLGMDTSLCEDDTLKLDIFHSGYNYLWQDGSVASFYNITFPATYWAVVTDSNNCKSSDTIFVSEIAKPKINVGKDTSICEKELPFLIELPLNQYLYKWQNGSSLNYISAPDTGLYYVTATNICGSYTDSIYLNLKECTCSIGVPTAFSPNNDGVNDVLFMRGNCVEDINLYIYDRWGQKVFESHDLLNGWDGSFNGKKMDPAIFAYYLSAVSTYEKDRVFIKKGNISLIK